MAIDTTARPASGPAASAEPGRSAPPPRAAASDLRRRRGGALLLPIVLVLVAGTLRFAGLAHPERCYFDETYYYYDARDLLEQGTEDGFVVHPPLGKWVIAGGLAVFGLEESDPLEQAVTDEPGQCVVGEDEDPNPAARQREAAEAFARRSAMALLGTLTVLLTYLAGLRLFRRRGMAGLAALLVAVDGIALTMSRIAMLDAALSFFVMAGFHQLLVDRDRMWEGAGPDTVADPHRPLPRRGHRHRWLAGLCFGLALSTKWSALLAIGAAGLFVLASEVAWRRRLTGRWWVEPQRWIASGLATLVLVPALVYVASYAGWVANFPETRFGEEQCPEGVCEGVTLADRVGTWVRDQRDIAGFHDELQAEHSYRASATTWPTLSRPVSYYYEDCDDEQLAAGTCTVEPGNVAEILGIGNPAIWWLALLAYPLLLWSGVRERSWAAWAILVFLLVQYVPWLVIARPLFLFYTTPLVPFLCLGLAFAAGWTARFPLWRWVPTFVAVVAVGGLLFWWPLLVGLEVPRSAWDLRILFRSWI